MPTIRNEAYRFCDVSPILRSNFQACLHLLSPWSMHVPTLACFLMPLLVQECPRQEAIRHGPAKERLAHLPLCLQRASHSVLPDAAALDSCQLSQDGSQLRYIIVDGRLSASLSSPLQSSDGLYIGPLQGAPPEAAAELVCVSQSISLVLWWHEHPSMSVC